MCAMSSRTMPEHIIRWLAHRVQCPQEKINHALVLGGNQGIGKDTLLEPVKRAIGPWNFAEVKPQQVLGRFNGFLKSVILRVSEARDLGDVDRFQFYDHMKDYTAAPPDVLQWMKSTSASIPSLIAAVSSSHQITRQTAFICQPMTDAISWHRPILQKKTSRQRIGTAFWSWYERGGHGHVAAYLSRA